MFRNDDDDAANDNVGLLVCATDEMASLVFPTNASQPFCCRNKTISRNVTPKTVETQSIVAVVEMPEDA